MPASRRSRRLPRRACRRRGVRGVDQHAQHRARAVEFLLRHPGEGVADRQVEQPDEVFRGAVEGHHETAVLDPGRELLAALLADATGVLRGQRGVAFADVAVLEHLGRYVGEDQRIDLVALEPVPEFPVVEGGVGSS